MTTEQYRFDCGTLFELTEGGDYLACFTDYRCRTKHVAIKAYEEKQLNSMEFEE